MMPKFKLNRFWFTRPAMTAGIDMRAYKHFGYTCANVHFKMKYS